MGCRCCRYRAARDWRRNQDENPFTKAQSEVRQLVGSDGPDEEKTPGAVAASQLLGASSSTLSVEYASRRSDAYADFLCRIRGEYIEPSFREEAVFVCSPGEFARRVRDDWPQISYALSHNTDLQVLTMSCDLRDSGAAWMADVLRRNRSIRFLDISSNNISNQGAAEIANALSEQKILLDLNLRDNELEDRGASAMAVVLENNQSLTALDLGSNQVGVEGIAALMSALAQNSTLRCFKLSFASFGMEEVQSLAEVLKTNQSLEEVDLSYTNYLVDDEELREDIAIEMAHCFKTALRRNATLVKLDLSNNGIDAEYLGELQHLLDRNAKWAENWGTSESPGVDKGRQLDEVAPVGMSLSSIAIEIPGDLLTGDDTYAEFLWRIQGMFEDPGQRMNASLILRPGDQAEQVKAEMEMISLTLISNTELRDLTLSCGFGDSGAMCIASVLEQNTVLQNLDVSSNDISEIGAAEIAGALRRNSTLTGLNLRDNNLGDSGAKVVSKMLHHNESLITLDLGSNRINDEGLHFLVSALMANSTLRHFRLSFTEFDHVCDVLKFASVIETNQALLLIDLSYNNFLGSDDKKKEIAAAMVKHFLQALEVNSTLLQLELGHNGIDGKDLAKIELALAKNKLAGHIGIDGKDLSKMEVSLAESRAGSQNCNDHLSSCAQDGCEAQAKNDGCEAQAKKDGLEVQSTRSNISDSSNYSSQRSNHSSQTIFSSEVAADTSSAHPRTLSNDSSQTLISGEVPVERYLQDIPLWPLKPTTFLSVEGEERCELCCGRARPYVLF